MLTRSSHILSGTLWLGAYLLFTLLPLLFVVVTPHGPGRSFWTEFSVGLGFVGLAMMCLQFVLIARFSWLKAPYGSDVIYAFHRTISVVAIVFVLAHPIILYITRWDIMKTRHADAPWPWGLGMIAAVCLVWLIVVSFLRKPLRMEYDAWRRAHALLAVVAIACGIAHILLIDRYLALWWQKALWLGYCLAWIGLIAYVRTVKPAMELRRPFRVASVEPVRGNAVRLVIEPDGHEGFRFSPGQFAWITLWDSPFSDREHPFSFSGSAAAAPRLEFTIKELGDWTRKVRTAQVGQPVYVDGPFGALSADRHPQAEGFALFAGGIGITPMISHVRTFKDRSDTRPLWLFYAAKSWDDLTYREELEALRAQMPTLTVIYVLGSMPQPRPDTSPTLELGFVTADLIKQHAPRLGQPGARIECFICGPGPMMNAVERALASLGVPLGDFHSERFNLV